MTSLTNVWRVETSSEMLFDGVVYADHLWVVAPSVIEAHNPVDGTLSAKINDFPEDIWFATPFEGGIAVAGIHGLVKLLTASISEDGTLIYQWEDYARLSGLTDETGWWVAAFGSIYFTIGARLWRLAPRSAKVPGNLMHVDVPVQISWVTTGANLICTVVDGGFVEGYDPYTLQRKEFVYQFKPGPINWIARAGVISVLGQNASTLTMLNLKNFKTWSRTFGSATRAAAISEKYIFAALEEGVVEVLDTATGEGVSQIELTDPDGGRFKPSQVPMYLDTGLLYVFCDRAIVVVNLKSELTEALRVVSPIPMGILNGALYYSARQNNLLGCTRISSLLRRFYAESTLLQDISFADGLDGKKAAQKDALIQSEITLFTEQGGPYGGQLISLAATAPAVITVNGTELKIGTQPQALQTDLNGKFRFTMPAGALGPDGNLDPGFTAPAIRLRATFMDDGLEVVFRPDAQLHDKLVNLDADQLERATDFDGKPAIKPEFANDKAALTSAAGMIKATASMVQESAKKKRESAAMSRRYIEVGSQPEVISCCETGDYTCRPICERNFAFQISTTGSTFAYLDEKQTDEWLKAHPVNTGAAPQYPDLWDALRSGAGYVDNAIFYAVNQVVDDVNTVVTVIIDGIEYVYGVAVKTIEEAALVIQGIFQKIATSINAIIEALSFLFNWGYVLQVQQGLQKIFNDSLRDLTTPDINGKSQIAIILNDVKARLQTYRDKVDEAFRELKREHVDESTPTEPARQADPNSNYAVGGSKSNWLSARLEPSLLASMGASSSASAALAAQSPIAFPDLRFPESFTKEVENLFTDLAHTLGDDFKQTLERIAADLDPNRNPTLWTGALSALLDLIRGVVDMGIDVMADIISATVKLVDGFMRAVTTYFNEEIDVPYLSDLYKFITRSDKPLTILGLVTLTMAVPVSIAVKFESSSSEEEWLKAIALTGMVSLDWVWGGIQRTIWFIEAASGYADLYTTKGKIIVSVVFGLPDWIFTYGNIMLNVPTSIRETRLLSLALQVTNWLMGTLGLYLSDKVIDEFMKKIMSALLDLITMGCGGLFLLNVALAYNKFPRIKNSVKTNTAWVGIINSISYFSVLGYRAASWSKEPETQKVAQFVVYLASMGLWVTYNWISTIAALDGTEIVEGERLQST